MNRLLLDIESAAEYCSVSPETMKGWIVSGVVVPAPMPGSDGSGIIRKVLIDRPQLYRLLKLLRELHGKPVPTREYLVDKVLRKRKAIRETSKSESKEDAQTLLRIREGDTARGVLIPGRIGFTHLVNDMMNEYWMHQKKSFRDVGYRVTKHVLPYFGNTMAQDITTATLNDYKLFRQEQKASNGTINRELAAIRRAFNLGIENGTVVVVPKFRMLPEGRPRRGFFSEEELHALCKYLSPDLRPLVIFGFITGWRKQEILGLEWRNVDFKAGEIRLEAGTTKNDEGRVFPMTPDLRELLTAQRKRTDMIERKRKQIIPLVFHRNGYQIKSFKKAWAIACEMAKLVGRYFHDFRRTASRNWAIKVGTHVAMQIIGHKTRYVFDRYRIVSKKDLQEVAKTRILKGGK